MDRRTGLRTVCFLALLVGIGCASTRVKKNPGPHDHGLRYYLPKPYLLVDRADIPIDATGKSTRPSKNVVRLKIDYLPDFTEEYAVHIRTGIGKNATDLTLTDGWRLEKIDVNVDSKASEFVGAISKLIGTEPKLLEGNRKPTPTPGGGGPELADGMPELCVEAYDVPLGYYEAVVSRSADGTKRLYGWRYVGFAPFANCPLEPQGVAGGCCQQAELYGLVSVGKKMYFRKLSELAAHPTSVKTAEDAPPMPAPTPMGTQPPPGETGYIVIPTPVKDLPVQPKKWVLPQCWWRFSP